jgi:hypothetical protein
MPGTRATSGSQNTPAIARAHQCLHEEDYNPNLPFDLVESLTALEYEGSDYK